MLAAVDLCIRTPGLLRVPASLLQYVNGIDPPLQVPAAELSLLVFLVTGTLSRLLDLDLVMRKLRRSFGSRGRDFARRQWTYPHLCGARAAGFGRTSAIVSEKDRTACGLHLAKVACAGPVPRRGAPRGGVGLSRTRTGNLEILPSAGGNFRH